MRLRRGGDLPGRLRWVFWRVFKGVDWGEVLLGLLGFCWELFVFFFLFDVFMMYGNYVLIFAFIFGWC